MKKYGPKKCLECDSKFMPSRKDKVYCTVKCGQKVSGRRRDIKARQKRRETLNSSTQCELCKSCIVGKRADAIYCSKKCADRSHKTNNIEHVKQKSAEYYEDTKERDRLKRKEYRKINKEQIKLRDFKYRLKNKHKLNKQHRVYRLNNSEQVAKSKRNHYIRNKSDYIARSAQRKAAKIRATPPWSDLGKIKVLYKKAKWLGSITGLEYHVDHIVPLQGNTVSGLHIWENLQILEASLNLSKNNRLINI